VSIGRIFIDYQYLELTDQQKCMIFKSVEKSPLANLAYPNTPINGKTVNPTIAKTASMVRINAVGRSRKRSANVGT
jgi:hypothetical protein